jgi:hypothetical protein
MCTNSQNKYKDFYFLNNKLFKTHGTSLRAKSKWIRRTYRFVDEKKNITQSSQCQRHTSLTFYYICTGIFLFLPSATVAAVFSDVVGQLKRQSTAPTADLLYLS